MAKLVEIPDGRIIEFPDSMSDQQIDVNLRLLLAREQGSAQAEAGAVARSTPKALSPNYEFAQTLHTDKDGNTLSFPHMAVPAANDPFAQSVSLTAATLPFGGPAARTGTGLAKALAAKAAANPKTATAAGLAYSNTDLPGSDLLRKIVGLFNPFGD